MADTVPSGRTTHSRPTVDDDRWTDLGDQIGRLAVVARAADVDTVVLRDPANLTWLLGCRVNVPQTLDSACLDVVVELSRPPRVTIVTNAIEAPRLRETELAGLDADWTVVPWWEGRDAQLPTGPRVGSDRPQHESVNLSAELVDLRRSLTAHQQDLLRGVCSDAASAATAAAFRLSPRMTEYEAAGLFAAELLARELDPIVLLVGGATRLDRHRHPLPTSTALGDRGMLVACGRRHGLVSSVTRIVSFAELDSAERDAYRRLLEVERVFLDQTGPGARLGDVVAAGTDAYGQNGFDPLEWHRHHQGGLTGWQPREFPAAPTSQAVLGPGHVVAWNPSGGGWKVEDTALVTDTGCEPLVHDPDWPTVDVAGRARPDVLVR